jgi:hypothetical protein
MPSIVELDVKTAYPSLKALIGGPPYHHQPVHFLMHTGRPVSISLADLFNENPVVRKHVERCFSSGFCRELVISTSGVIQDTFRLLPTRQLIAHYALTWVTMFQIYPGHAIDILDGVRQVFLTYLDNLQQRRILPD